MQFSLQQLLEHLQVPLIEVQELQLPPWLRHNDSPAGDLAQLGKDLRSGQWVVVGLPNKPVGKNSSYPDEVLHEACHLVCGPYTIAPRTMSEDEGPLMVYQWNAMRLLKPELYAQCREKFALYGLKSTGIGEDDSFLDSRDWRICVRKAIRSGLIDQEGTLLRRGVGKAWNRHSLKEWLTGDDPNSWRLTQFQSLQEPDLQTSPDPSPGLA